MTHEQEVDNLIEYIGSDLTHLENRLLSRGSFLSGIRLRLLLPPFVIPTEMLQKSIQEAK